MAFRCKLGYLKTLVSTGFQGGNRASFTNSTVPKMNAYAPSADHVHAYQQQQPGGAGKSTRGVKGDYVPVYVAIGTIALSVTFGIYTAKQQLMHNPQVYVRKHRRETIPEVVEPEHVVEDAEKFLKKSFFRKVAHIQENKDPKKKVIPDPVHKDAFAHEPHVVTLKSVGVDPVNA